MRFFTVVLLLITFLVSNTQADSLGRLFFTPVQRTQLESNRAREAIGENAPSSVLTVNGIVQQHNGARTVWINGKVQNSNQGGEPAAEDVAVPGNYQPVKIKVGQKLLLDTSQISPASAE